MNYSLSQAAKVTGKSKSSISRAIDTGRLSANRNGGIFEIDAAELHRVFPLKVDTDGVPLNGYKNVPCNDLDDRGTGNDYSILGRKIELLRERLGDKETQIDDLRGERDRLLKVIENNFFPRQQAWWCYNTTMKKVWAPGRRQPTISEKGVKMSYFPGQEIGDMPRRIEIDWAKETVLDAIDKMLAEQEQDLYIHVNFRQLEELFRQRNRVAKFLNLPVKHPRPVDQCNRRQ